MRDAVIGIDPGSKGMACIYYTAKAFYDYVDINDIDSLSRLFKAASMTDTVVAIEEVHAIFGSSAKSTFKFGYNVGIIHGLLKAFHVPYILVPPKKWQNEIWTASDRRFAGRVIDTKVTSLNAAKRLFPKIDFRRTERSKKEDDNKVDATLICEYARRKNL